ncbi:uncharacterized protein LOC108597041 [Drosophila busckii]|nr:uncharacterized protein LOC108597041 [Drosophila busckii]
MNMSILLFYLLLVAMLLLSIAPVTESTFLFYACIFRLNVCPFFTTER